MAAPLKVRSPNRVQLQPGKMQVERQGNHSQMTLVDAEFFLRNPCYYACSESSTIKGINWCLSRDGTFCFLFRKRNKSEMLELAENLSNLWVRCAADSWYLWVILILFVSGSDSWAWAACVLMSPKHLLLQTFWQEWSLVKWQIKERKQKTLNLHFVCLKL